MPYCFLSGSILRPLVSRPCEPRIVVSVYTYILTVVGIHEGLCYGVEGEGLLFEQDSFPIPILQPGAAANLYSCFYDFRRITIMCNHAESLRGARWEACEDIACRPHISVCCTGQRWRAKHYGQNEGTHSWVRPAFSAGIRILICHHHERVPDSCRSSCCLSSNAAT